MDMDIIPLDSTNIISDLFYKSLDEEMFFSFLH
jgi:hypothetical protein